MHYILSLEPEFKDLYEEHLKGWNGQSSTHSDFSEFSHFVASKLKSGSYVNSAKVFEGVEFLLTDNNADEDVQNAVCTCFLENLINFFSEDDETLRKFIPLLGPKSREFCRGWDEFTGVKTPGLWDETS